MEKDRNALYSGNSRAIAAGEGAWKEEENSRTVTLWPGAIVEQTALSGWRSMCFSCFSPLCHGINIKLRVKRNGILKEQIPIINGEKQLSDLSLIRSTDEQFVIVTGLTVHPTLLHPLCSWRGSCFHVWS